MILSGEKAKDTLKLSVQINNGFTDTSADGVNMAFDKKYGIMFCVYMPGPRGAYGESRGRISLSYFPASQPTNIKFVEISSGHQEYVPNIISLGGGRVRVFYEENSWMHGNHFIKFKDFCYLDGSLSDEKIVMLKKEDGNVVPLTSAEQLEYLRAKGYTNNSFVHNEQICFGSHTIFQRTPGGWFYGVITSMHAEPIFYRSSDSLQTVEFFAVCPYPAQYEADYKFIDDKMYAIIRTNRPEDSISFATSSDMGNTWSEEYKFKGSIQCRPRLIIHNGQVLAAYNYYDCDTGNRPSFARTSVRFHLGNNDNPEENRVVADLHSKYGIVNIALADIMGDVYMAYSTSELALEYQNGNPSVRGKDAVRYVKLGDLMTDTEE